MDETQSTRVHLISEIRETCRFREDLHRAEKRLTLQIKAVCRRLCWGELCEGNLCKRKMCPEDKANADALYKAIQKDPLSHPHGVKAMLVCESFLMSRSMIHPPRMRFEKQAQHLATQLHVWPWWESIRGLGALGLAQIIAEAGDLHNYANPAKLWKRMCVGLVQIDGEWTRQKKVKGAAALIHGYTPRRRSILYCVGDGIIKQGAGTEYNALYYAKRDFYREKWGPKETKGRIHRASQRYMEKRLLKHLWCRWRGEVAEDET